MRLLVIEGPDRGKEIPLDDLEEGTHAVGRDPRHAVSLADSAVSREHFQLLRLSRGFRLVDLGSRNRTFVNGEPVRECLLRDGDVISVGDSELRYECAGDEVEVTDMASTIIKEYPSLDGDSIVRLIHSLKGDTERRDRIREAVERLRQLFNLSREILRSSSREALYEKLLEILVPALEAHSAVVMLREGESWTTAASHQGGASGDNTTPIVISGSIVERVARDKKAVLSENAPKDIRFDTGDSIVEANISTVVAAPIGFPGRSDIVAVLYADRRGSGSAFTEDELHLLSAAAEQAGMVARHVESSYALREENRNLLRSISDARPIIGSSKAIAEVLVFVGKAAPTSMTVLIQGETGTGKDLVASAIHYQSPRRGKPFVAINCAALPENLLESELFGYEKGAFTGAMSRKKGRFELADGGTIFLDEIGEMSPGCQAKVLRLLEEQRFERVGGTEPIRVDVRIIAATNRQLATAIADGSFREDLFYRLNVLAVDLPSLRERPEDIPVLARHFLNETLPGADKDIISPAAEKKLLAYSWPGNVRQLRNVIESAVILKDGPKITPDDLVLGEGITRAKATEAFKPETLEELQRRHILRVLEHTGGNKKKAAEILGIERCTLYSKLKNFEATRG